MMNKTLHFLIPVAALLMLCCCHGNTAQQSMDNNDTIASQEPVTIDSTTVDGLIAYFPQFSRIDLVCGHLPHLLVVRRRVQFPRLGKFSHHTVLIVDTRHHRL